MIVVTGQGDRALAVEALRAGAADFIEKPYDADVILRAVAAALNGGPDGAGRGARTEIEHRVTTLSVKERQIFDRLTEGQSAASIAEELGLTPRSVEIHRTNLMTKMQATSFPDLVRMAVLLLAEPPAED